MSLASLQHAIEAGDSLLLDSTTLIAYLGGGERITPIAQHILEEWVKGGRNSAIVSTVTAMEIHVRPLQIDRARSQHAYDFLTHWPNLHVADVDLPTALQAANLRAFFAFKPPDALVIAGGMMHQVGHLVTNDQRWKRVPSSVVHVCYLGDHTPFPQ